MAPRLLPLLLCAVLGVTAHAAPPWRQTMDEFKKPSKDELRKTLTPLQYEVTQEEGTEPPFKNEYNDNKREGIYVDRVSGEPLFSSKEKYESGTGWPSFYKPLVSSNIVTKEDRSFFSKRVEVRSRHADSHLGHVFEDGPAPTGLRYCMNSAALRFVPKEELEAKGYGEFKTLFDKPKKTETATLAGGCFWGMEEILRAVPGVVETKVGYTGGTTPKPTYEAVKTGKTGHAESIELVFDPTKLSYEELLEKWFFKMHDPTTKDRQGNDAGSQYRSAIFYHGEQQKKTAEKVKERVEKSGKWKRPIVTQIAPASEFTPAEEYHQKYLVKNPGGYTCHFLRE